MAVSRAAVTKVNCKIKEDDGIVHVGTKRVSVLYKNTVSYIFVGKSVF